MDVKKIQRIVLVVVAFCAIWIGVALYLQNTSLRSSVEERRIANQSERAISEALTAFFEAKGTYPTTLDQLPLDKEVTRDFRYWTNANSGYSLTWESKYGFRSSVFTSQSNIPLNLRNGKELTVLTNDLDSAVVLEIARHAVSANDTWADRADFEKPKQKDDGSWTVMAWRRPHTLGGHRLITISSDGKVVSYSRGK